MEQALVFLELAHSVVCFAVSVCVFVPSEIAVLNNSSSLVDDSVELLQVSNIVALPRHNSFYLFIESSSWAFSKCIYVFSDV